jgi:hypothetical protein
MHAGMEEYGLRPSFLASLVRYSDLAQLPAAMTRPLLGPPVERGILACFLLLLLLGLTSASRLPGLSIAREEQRDQRSAGKIALTDSDLETDGEDYPR